MLCCECQKPVEPENMVRVHWGSWWFCSEKCARSSQKAQDEYDQWCKDHWIVSTVCEFLEWFSFKLDDWRERLTPPQFFY
jgi:hypothetical protein